MKNRENELWRLIELAESQIDKFMMIFIGGGTGTTDAKSGYLEVKEVREIEEGFSCSSTHYSYYHNPSTFVGDIMLNKLNVWKNRFLLLYSTAQIGVDVNRRAFLPHFSRLHNIHSLTCDSYQLSLLQNKYHYYKLLQHQLNVPNTIAYRGRLEEVSSLKDKKYILKPSWECSARGVTLIDSKSSEWINERLLELYLEYEQPILIQEFVEGTEVEVPVLVIEGVPLALPPVQILKEQSSLTWEAVMNEKYGFARLPDSYDVEKIQRAAETAIGNLEGSGLCRVDFIIDAEGIPWLFDIAALPLISKHSSCYTSFAYLFPDHEYALYKAVLGAKLIELV